MAVWPLSPDFSARAAAFPVSSGRRSGTGSFLYSGMFSVKRSEGKGPLPITAPSFPSVMPGTREDLSSAMERARRASGVRNSLVLTETW